jgi:hypothetical protein
MTLIAAIRKRAGFLATGLVSFIAVLAIYRAANGQSLVQPQSDFGILIGFALVALVMGMSDLRASEGTPEL